ncbi:MAG: threonine ammonia-lyase, biosynthetic [Spirochaetia bacterium]|nr:threonine ammonia-lyase, biosynthetic [Spirochaetia bacterium]
MEDIVKKILISPVYDVADVTPLDYGKLLSERLKNQIFLKREDLQPVFSFKLRGAYHKIARLSEAERSNGIICASAGNHAQGVALSANRLGIDATIVMPRTTPRIKVNAVEHFGVTVVLAGDSYSDAYKQCLKLVEETGMTFIHPFDDPEVIAGQGTIGHELLQQCPDLDMVFVPIGGGGLIAGIASYIKYLRPNVKIIGVQPEDSDAMFQSVNKKKRVELESVGIFADGVAVKKVGELTYKIVSKLVDEIITVTTDEICSAIKSIYEDTRSIVEPAGALAVAGVTKYVHTHNILDHKLIAINSGANMNFERLQFVSERTRIGEKTETLLAVTIPEKPGSLKNFCNSFIGDKSITEFNYRLMGRGDAHIFVGINLPHDEKETLCSEMTKGGYPCEDLSDNELAKLHIRHMVGGRTDHAANEVIYRFHFPERPRALSDFLNAMAEDWNISMFHYRMHGGDFGRVLIGFEIPEKRKKEFSEFLKKINYACSEETENPAYRLFL